MSKCKELRGIVESLGGIVEYIFLGRKCKSPGSGKIKAGVFISQEELFIPQSDRLCLAEVGQLSSEARQSDQG